MTRLLASERDIDLRRHLLRDHPHSNGRKRSIGSVRLATYILHRRLHDTTVCDHTHKS